MSKQVIIPNANAQLNEEGVPQGEHAEGCKKQIDGMLEQVRREAERRASVAAFALGASISHSSLTLCASLVCPASLASQLQWWATATRDMRNKA